MPNILKHIAILCKKGQGNCESHWLCNRVKFAPLFPQSCGVEGCLTGQVPQFYNVLFKLLYLFRDLLKSKAAFEGSLQGDAVDILEVATHWDAVCNSRNAQGAVLE